MRSWAVAVAGLGLPPKSFQRGRPPLAPRSRPALWIRLGFGCLKGSSNYLNGFLEPEGLLGSELLSPKRLWCLLVHLSGPLNDCLVLWTFRHPLRASGERLSYCWARGATVGRAEQMFGPLSISLVLWLSAELFTSRVLPILAGGLVPGYLFPPLHLKRPTEQHLLANFVSCGLHYVPLHEERLLLLSLNICWRTIFSLIWTQLISDLNASYLTRIGFLDVLLN